MDLSKYLNVNPRLIQEIVFQGADGETENRKIRL